MQFEQLKVADPLIKILKNSGILTPTEIQTKTFPSAVNGHDVIGISQTGSGKTLAFVLPILQQILSSDKPFHTLILVPTRELAQQICDTVNMFEALNIRTALLLGGEDFNTQVYQINKKPHLIIGTPGRIMMHIKKNKNFHIERIRKLVFDEADRFCESDFSESLEILAKKLSKKNQTLMFTATLTEKTKALANIFMRSPKIFGNYDLSTKVETITENFILVPEKYKLAALVNYIKQNTDVSIIVFVSLCITSHKVGMTLEKLGISCKYLHGKMIQRKREENIKSFKTNEVNVLISTDLASRGLDIPQVEIVINYDLPECSKNIHIV